MQPIWVITFKATLYINIILQCFFSPQFWTDNKQINVHLVITTFLRFSSRLDYEPPWRRHLLSLSGSFVEEPISMSEFKSASASHSHPSCDLLWMNRHQTSLVCLTCLWNLCQNCPCHYFSDRGSVSRCSGPSVHVLIDAVEPFL